MSYPESFLAARNAHEAPALLVDSLCVETTDKHDPKVVLDTVSFHVNAGETVCLVGESGSGKSVTSLAAMGLLPEKELQVQRGSIEINGVDMLSLSAKELRAMRTTQVAMVFQEPMTALNPVQPVGKQIDEVLRLHTRMNSAERYERVLHMLDSVGMPEPPRIYHSYPHQLSGGQRQRVMIAMALILNPKVLIADEPTTALDVTTQKQILSLISELRREFNTAVLFITHDFGVVADIADRIVVMRHGQIVESGEKLDILTNPQKEYTRALITSVPSLVPPRQKAIKSKPILRVNQLCKEYPGKRRLFSKSAATLAAVDINFSLSQREIIGIVGESGSGKSTVARCVAHLMPPTAGSIQLNRTEIATKKIGSLGKLRRDIQIVFQDPYRSLNPRMTISASLTEGLTNFGVPYEQALIKVSELLHMVGLDESALKRYPHQFSGGQRQRICIARALALEPQVLIADEAVSALDVSVQAQILDILREIRERIGIAILFITHDLRVAAQICDDILVMHRGQIVENGPTHRVLTNPENDYTRTLISAAPGRNWDFQNLSLMPPG